MIRFGHKSSAVRSFAGFGEFVLKHREEVLRSWIAAVERHPKISASDNLTYTQLLDHLPELCTELAALLKQPDADQVKKNAKRDAKAHGWKRWRQGYKLEELIRELCLIRRDFIETWLPAFATANAHFDIESQNGAQQLVDRFFDNVIIEATVQFVEEHHQTVRRANAKLRARKKASAAARVEFVQLVSHQLREPLAPLLLAFDVLLQEESLSPRGIETIQMVQRSVKEEARAIKELLKIIQLM
jgi:hypothetical protein